MDSSSHTEVLILLAEVSVAVAGFAGIVGAIAKPTGETARADLKALVAGAVGVLFFSLLALVIAFFPISADIFWRLMAACLSIYVIWYYLVNRQDIRFLLTSPRWIIVMAGDLLMLLVLLATIGGMGFVGGAAVYLGSLLWILSQTLVFFALAMAALWQGGAE